MEQESMVQVGLELDKMCWLVKGMPKHEILSEMLKLNFEGFDSRILKANFDELFVALKTELH